jgi:ADP-ribose pyrophosphatase
MTNATARNQRCSEEKSRHNKCRPSNLLAALTPVCNRPEHTSHSTNPFSFNEQRIRYDVAAHCCGCRTRACSVESRAQLQERGYRILSRKGQRDYKFVSAKAVPHGYIVLMATKAKQSIKPKSRVSKKVKVLSSRSVYRGKVFQVTQDEIIEPNGVRATRDVVRHSGSVVILAVDDSPSEPHVLLARQYRYSADDYLWELPAGRKDDGESPLAGAKRELIEETGYTAAKWKQVLFFYPSPGFLDETMAVFLAQGLRRGKARPEEDEVISKRLFPLSSAVNLVVRGKIRDGKTIAGVLWLASQYPKTRS